ncbi:MAG TPA: extracellular solute-binding protein [Ruminiclostridium sp.]
MNKIFIRTIVLSLLCAIILSLTACGKVKTAEVPKGRYVEEDLSSNLDLGKDGYIYDLVRLEDNTLEIIADKKDVPLEVYISKDSGKTWSKKNISNSIIPTDNKISSATADEKGNIIIAYGLPKVYKGNIEYHTFDSKISYAKVDAVGKSTPLSITLPKITDITVYNSLHSIKVAANGDLFGVDGSGSVYQIDLANGKIKNKYTSNSGISLYTIVGTTLIAATSSKMAQYDITTGKALADLTILKDYIPITESGDFIMTNGIAKNELCFSNKKGLYRYILGGNLVERMVDGSLSSFSSLDMFNVDVVEITDGQYLALYRDKENKFSFMNYEYSKTIASVPSNELTVYSLKDNATIKQEILLFQKSNPDIRVIFETGLTEKDAVTAEDARKTLNTEILAGKGPDLIVLDEMPLNSYIDKGILADISDIMGAYIPKGELFENIANAYKKNDKFYATPLRFDVPVMFGGQETLNKITDLKSFGDYIVDFRKSKPNATIFGFNDGAQLVRELFAVNADSWINEDGTVDKNKLTDFISLTKYIYKDAIKVANPKVLFSMQTRLASGQSSKNSKVKAFDSFWPLSVNNGTDQLSIGSISWKSDLMHITSAISNKSSLNYKMFNEEKKYFEPLTVVGINSKTANVENAKKFLTYLLSEEGQKVDLLGGFPINKNVFSEVMKAKDLTEEIGSVNNGIKMVMPSEKQFTDFTAMMEQLKTPIFQNSIILDAVLEASDKCLNDEISVDEAVNSIIAKINLYLSE